MRFLLTFLAVALGWCGALVPAFADEPILVNAYNEFSESAHISGPELKAKSLKGKVVLWEYWGLQCPPCRASMPHLQEIYEKYARRGRLIVVASHVQGASPRVKTYLDEQGLTFPVYQHASIPGVSIPGGIPFTVLIGANGKVIAKGSPRKVFEQVEKLMKKIPAGEPLFPDFKAVRYKTVLAALVSEGANLEAKVDSIRTKEDDEAKALCRLFDDWAKNEIRDLKFLLKEKSFESVPAYDALKKSLPEAVKPLTAKVDAIRKDRAYIALADLSKKTEALELRREKGRKISEKNVESLQKKLIPFLESDRKPVKDAALLVRIRLNALQPK